MPTTDHEMIEAANAVDTAMQRLHSAVAASGSLRISDPSHASAEAATSAAFDRVAGLLERLARAPAATLGGVKAKAAAALAVGDLFEDDVVELHRAIAHDLAAIALPAA
jgi:hypothetical protein